MLPERQCLGCKRQKDWGCKAKRWRTPGPDEPDGPENWIEPAYLPLNFMGEEVFSCPRQPMYEDPMYWMKLMRFYALFKAGHLPDQGAVVDQSSRALDLFRILDNVNAECDRAEDDLRRAKMERGRQGRDF